MTLEKKITPTMTLAQLYEAQKQYFDAFTLYNMLYRANPNEEILSRMKTIEKKIFSDMSLEYNKITEQIFTETDKEKFRLIPEANFQNFKMAMDKENFEPIVFQTEEFEEPAEEDFEAEPIEEEYIVTKSKTEKLDDQILSDIIETPTIKNDRNTKKTGSKSSAKKKETDLLNMTITEFSTHLINLLKKDKKISELTLKEIKKIKKILIDLL